MLTPFILAPHIEFSKPLHDVEVVEKETAKFECEVSRENVKVCQYGKSKWRIYLFTLLYDYVWDAVHVHSGLCQVCWYKDGSEIRKGKKYEIVCEGRRHILVIHKSAFDDEAEYECDAKTSKSSGMLTVVGKIMSIKMITNYEELSTQRSVCNLWFFVYITKEEATKFTKNLSNVEGTETDSVKLICEVSKPSADVRWFRGDEELPEGGRFEHIVDGKKRILLIQDLKLADAGEYNCRLSPTVKTSANLAINGEW